MPYAHCDACRKPQEECLCRETCSLCGIRTNHTTTQHEEAMIPRCVDCDISLADMDDPEARRCRPCADENMAYRFADWCDTYGKEDK